MKTKEEIQIEYLESINKIQETQIKNRDEYVESLLSLIDKQQEIINLYKKLFNYE